MEYIVNPFVKQHFKFADTGTVRDVQDNRLKKQVSQKVYKGNKA